MSVMQRLRRLESLFDSLYWSDQLKLMELRARRSELAERRDAIQKALSSENPCMIGLMKDLLSNSVRLAAAMKQIEVEIAEGAKGAAPRKAQLERVRRHIAGAAVAAIRKSEQATVDEISTRSVRD
ncbi:MAG: hypothetical protein APF80_01855 [Alphaproteobacteria bacterium BRH_c36]|nr:MAG: hypothetical protein APF80_01855 [Alphaproteobacteria bacterium BRH_c36]